MQTTFSGSFPATPTSTKCARVPGCQGLAQQFSALGKGDQRYPGILLHSHQLAPALLVGRASRKENMSRHLTRQQKKGKQGLWLFQVCAGSYVVSGETFRLVPSRPGKGRDSQTILWCKCRVGTGASNELENVRQFARLFFHL